MTRAQTSCGELRLTPLRLRIQEKAGCDATTPLLAELGARQVSSTFLHVYSFEDVVQSVLNKKP